MATKSAAAQSGVFVVDLSGLNLSKSALQGMEKAINSTVQKQLATLDLRIGSGGIIGKRPECYGYLDSMRIRQFACDLAILGFVLGA
jgi:hypothetical protein